MLYPQEVSGMDRSAIIGRKHETDRLDRCMDSSEPQLIALYGRRRVGKTFLVNHYFNGGCSGIVQNEVTMDDLFA